MTLIDEQADNSPITCKMFLVDDIGNVISRVPEDEGDHIPVAINKSKPFKFPVSILKRILEACDTSDVVEMVGEDSIVSAITLESVFRVFSLGEIMTMFGADDMDEDFINRHKIDSSLFKVSFIQKLAEENDLFQDWADQNDLQSWDEFWENLSLDDCMERFDTNDILYHIERVDAVEYFGLDDIISDVSVSEILECLDEDDVLECFTAEDVVNFFPLDELIKEMDIEELIECIGADKVIDEIGLDQIVENEMSDILKKFTAKNLAMGITEENLVEALRIQRENT